MRRIYNIIKLEWKILQLRWLHARLAQYPLGSIGGALLALECQIKEREIYVLLP